MGKITEEPFDFHKMHFPASRFIEAQAWWIASEISRRSPSLRIADSWQLGGFYHGLTVGSDVSGHHAFFNFLGHVHYSGAAGHGDGPTWGRTLAADSPHEIVKEIERAMGWEVSHAPKTTPRSLVYRVIADVLSRKVNEVDRWTVADAYSAGEFVDWPDFLDNYLGCRHALQADKQSEPPPSTRVWLLRRGLETVALLSDMGLLFSTDQPPVELMPLYKKRRRLDDVVDVVLSGA